MLVWLSAWSEVQIVCNLYIVQLRPLHPNTPSSLASTKSRLIDTPFGADSCEPKKPCTRSGCTLAPAGEYELANDSCTAAMRVRIKVRWSFYAKIGNRYFITSHLLIPLIVSCDRSWQSQLILCPVDWRMKSFSCDEWTRLNCKCPHAASNCIESGTGAVLASSSWYPIPWPSLACAK